MTRSILTLFFAAALAVVASGRDDDDPPKKDDPDKPRLKRKKRDGDVPVKPQDRGDKAKAEPEKKKDKKDDEKLVPEDGPMPEAQEDDKDILARLERNLRSVEEKLNNREVGEPTQQQQRDILKDLDALIRRSQQQEQGGGGGADQQPQDGMDDKDQKDGQKQGGAKQQQAGKQGQKQGGKQQRAQRQPRQGRGQKQGNQQAKAGEGEKEGQPKQQQGAGNNPGGGGDGPRNDKEKDDKTYKDVWGHLPESLRAEMNAYSNPRPFMPRYDDLIKKYYRTIAEQGRKKGE